MVFIGAYTNLPLVILTLDKFLGKLNKVLTTVRPQQLVVFIKKSTNHITRDMPVLLVVLHDLGICICQSLMQYRIIILVVQVSGGANLSNTRFLLSNQRYLFHSSVTNDTEIE